VLVFGRPIAEREPIGYIPQRVRVSRGSPVTVRELVLMGRGATTEETALGVLFPTAMAIGVAVMSASSTYRPDLMAYLFGSILAVRSGDLWLLGGLAVATVGVVGLFFKELVFLSIDEDAARATMIRTRGQLRGSARIARSRSGRPGAISLAASTPDT
jgi:hypothetical protein